jgi:hypothetical protein
MDFPFKMPGREFISGSKSLIEWDKEVVCYAKNKEELKE